MNGLITENKRKKAIILRSIFLLLSVSLRLADFFFLVESGSYL